MVLSLAQLSPSFLIILSNNFQFFMFRHVLSLSFQDIRLHRSEPFSAMIIDDDLKPWSSHLSVLNEKQRNQCSILYMKTSTSVITSFFCSTNYRVSQKKGHDKILWISRLLRSLEYKFCTFFNSPSHPDIKNDLISIQR